MHHTYTCFDLGPTPVQIPLGISIGSAVLHSSQQKLPIFYSGPPLPLKITLAHEGSGPCGIWTPCNICLFRSTPLSIPNGISIGSAVFCTVHGRWSLYFITSRPFPLIIAPLHGISGPPYDAWFPGPTRVHTVHKPNGMSIGSAVLQSSRLWQTEGQTTLFRL